MFLTRRTTTFLLSLSAVMCGCRSPHPPEEPVAAGRLPYPITLTTNVVDLLHGERVPDPYRWLEDTDSTATRAWIEAQNRVTDWYLNSVEVRPWIRRRLTELWNFERFGIPFQRGVHFFFTRNDGLQPQSVLYVTEALNEPARVLINPNEWAADGTVALAGLQPTIDGRFLAFGQATAGSDWQEWQVIEPATGRILPDRVQWVKASGVAWTRNGEGFFYSRYDEPEPGATYTGVNLNHKLHYHRLGSSQQEDLLVYERPDQPEWMFHPEVSEDGRWLVIHVSHGTDPRNRIFVKDLDRPDSKVVELLPDFDAGYSFVDNRDAVLLFRTDLNAPRGRIVAIDVADPARERWREVVAEAASTLERASSAGDHLFLTYLEHACSRVRVCRFDGTPLRDVELPGLGSAGGFQGLRQSRETFFSFTSFASPPAIHRLDIETGRASLLWRAPLAFKPADYVTRQVFYRSRDGTRIPMFISHRVDVQPDGRTPTLLYGYGGFGISLKPSFSVFNLAWMELGGVYAVPNLRGGGEYGEEWHQAGTRLEKQNVFDDFIAAAEWLIANNITSSRELAIAGGSNGGLLVGACMTQRPSLFAVALPSVGVLDMIRFHKFTIGWAWTSDYGSPENEAEFRALRAYSPLHNVRPGSLYPATLITTADHDDRVVPAHSFKFAAALQTAQAGTEPVLIRIDTRAGHGAGKPLNKQLEEATDRLSFLVTELRVPWPGAEPASRASSTLTSP